MLYFLSESNAIHRILRRGIVIGLLTCVSVVIYDYAGMAPEWIIPLITAAGAILDKLLREYKNIPVKIKDPRETELER